MRPRPEPVPVGSRRAPWIVVLVSTVLVVSGLAGRLADSPAAPTSAAVSHSSRAMETPPRPEPTQAPLIRLISPSPDVLWYRSGLVRVRGRAPGVGQLRASVTIGARRIGAATIDVAADGSFADWLPIVPPAARSRAILQLQDVKQPERVLLASPLYVQAGDAVFIWSPAEADVPITGERMIVSGPVLAPVDQVRVLLRDRAGRTLAEVTRPVHGTGPGSAGGGVPGAQPGYRVELSLPDDSPAGRSHLYVFGLEGRTGEVIDRADTRVTLGP